MEKVIQPIENHVRGLRIVHNPKPPPPPSDAFEQLFGVPAVGDWDIVGCDGEVIESCETERAARQTAGFYAWLFGF